MKIRDIVNRDIVNLDNCDQEPIHVPGSIQPHGCLVAFRKSDAHIEFCSGNTAAFLGVAYDTLLAKSLGEVFGDASYGAIKEYLPSLTGAFVSPLPLEVNGKSFHVTIHESDGLYIMEFELALRSVYDLSMYYNQTRQLVSYMEHSSSMQALCQGVADETRAITGYDRVMIYRFDEDYNGEVYAESKRDDLEAFLGLHYPHTDIPVQARELYMKNLLRLIVDVGYQPVPIYTLDDGTAKQLDLSHAVLRSVSPIHIQYLHNIGVGATLTISLLHNNKLWGLIACHHYDAKFIDGFTRISAQLQGHFLTSQISVRQVEEQHRMANAVKGSLQRMLSRTFSLDRQSLKDIVAEEDMRRLCHAAGAVVYVDNDFYTNGTVPPEPVVRDLVRALREQAADKKVVITARLVDLYPAAANFGSTAAGVVFHALDDVLNMGVIWFRPETIEEVHWAGDPNKAIEKDVNGLSPRKSFELWKQVIRFQSKAWTDAEISAAANFAKSLERQMHLLFLSEEETKYRRLSEQLKETNAELENMNWISTHDLKEPLRKIQLFASHILEENGEGLSPAVVKSVTKVSLAANRMQQLIADIVAYSRVHDHGDALIDTDLNIVVKDVVDELADDLRDHGATIEVNALPRVAGIGFMLKQLFVNLIRNSLKFSRDNVPLRVTISAQQVDDPTPAASGAFHQVTISDNGIGFQQTFAESIFKVFTRLHAQEEYAGSGIGLAICKKIMRNHGGFISATGRLNEGAQFRLFFPIKT